MSTDDREMWCNCQAPSRAEGPWHPPGDTPYCPASPESTDDTTPTTSEWRAACDTVRRGMPPDATTVICGADIEVTHRSKDADGTYRVTTKRKEST